ncbi:MAG: NAD(P)-dependent oxidoreductase [Succinivibrionaceae bacterium]|nr:NAD(P)-dependent oxidoreductase [Succinivibrionaceae bacterium]
MARIAIIGTGIMGSAMAQNLLRRGHELRFYARRPGSGQDLERLGATRLGSVGEAVAGCDAVLTVVGGPQDVEQIYLGPGGILAHAAPGALLIDHTTSSPALAVRLHAEGKARGLRVLDAPVTGGDVGAREGTLSVLIGGEKDDFEAAREILGAIGSTLTLMGGPGAGQHAKCVNQIMVAAALGGLSEGLAYATAQGLDLQALLSAISPGLAGSKVMDLYAGRIIAGDLAPGGFIKFLIKDLRIALEGAAAAGLRLEATEGILGEYEDMLASGQGDLGTHALIRHYIGEDGKPRG